MDNIARSFLGQQRAQALALADSSDLIGLTVLPGEPPQRYILAIRANGLVQGTDGSIREFDRCDIGIYLPGDYVRVVRPEEVLTYLGPHARPFHPNLRPPFCCVHIPPGMALTDLIYAVHEIWTWTLVGTADNGLNPAAAEWARRQDPDRFPVDRRPLKRRTATTSTRDIPHEEAKKA